LVKFFEYDRTFYSRGDSFLLEKGLSYDDVLLKPKKTSVTSLKDVDTSTRLGSLQLKIPVISAPMDTVTETEMAEAIAFNGGLGVIHRFMSVNEQAEQVEKVKNADVGPDSTTGENGKLAVGAAIGLNDFERAERLVEVQADALVLDIAHGHHEQLLEEVEQYSEKYSNTDLIVGNIATAEAAEDLEKAGADVIKVGIGPGSACTTREMTGAGVPQFTAVQKCAQAVNTDIIADGGIKKPGDLAKALMAGSKAGMIGGMFAGTQEAPGELIEENQEKFKAFRGMASNKAAEQRAERQNREAKHSDKIPEGISTKIPFKGSITQTLNNLEGGLKSSISYCGAEKLEKARQKAEFTEITSSTQLRNGKHI